VLRLLMLFSWRSTLALSWGCRVGGGDFDQPIQPNLRRSIAFDVQVVAGWSAGLQSHYGKEELEGGVDGL
jgi:hypothetical protein